MTSFGVRQWLKAMDALPKAISDLYLLGCPTFFVDQLNMVLNFGGPAKVLTVVAPHTCPSCGVESGELIDALAERGNLAKGVLPDKECARCGGKLEFDETAESYFAFIGKYGASSISLAAGQLLAAHNLYTTSDHAPRSRRASSSWSTARSPTSGSSARSVRCSARGRSWSAPRARS
jgi:hypothetical protein